MSWIISKALMNSLYSQEQVEVFSEDTSLDGKQSVQSSGNHIPQAYCAPDKMMGFSRLSRFGMTCKPLMENLGEELLTLYLEGFHVKTSQLQEKAQVSQEHDQVCGNTWLESSEKSNQLTFLQRIPLCSALEDSVLSSKILPKWGMMLNGECYPQPKLAQTTKGTESGLSPNNETFFHTPCTTGLDGGSNSRKALKKRLQNWPTPTTRDYKGKSGIGRQERKGNPKDTLPNAIGGNLNPTWVEWLMGWPLGWTDLKPLVMDKSHFVPQQLGES